jgi:opacity protein-like surface antigen
MEMSQFGVAGCPGSTCQAKGDSTVVHANRMDLFAAAQLVQANGITVNALAGYKRDFSKWQTFGGVRNFGAPLTLPPGLSTSYEQTWSTPYLGLSAAYKSGAWTVDGRVIGSAWATGEDRTQNHLDSSDTVGKFGKGTFVGADLAAAYRVNPTTSITAGYAYQAWGLSKGSSTTKDTTGVTVAAGDAAGANNVSHLLSLGLKIDLNTPGAASAGRDIARASPWTGWYAGVTSGPDWLRAKWETKSLGVPAGPLNAGTASQSLDDSGARLGGLAGYTWQTGAWVWGVEADLSRSTASATKVGIPGVNSAATQPLSSDAAIVSSGWDGSLRLRAGTELLPNLFPNLLIYGTAGVAFQQTTAQVSCPGSTGMNSWCTADRDEKISQVRAGLTAGIGYEKQFAGNWFTRGEYRYTTTGGADNTFFASIPADAVAAKIDTSSHRLNFGVGYRF